MIIDIALFIFIASVFFGYLIGYFLVPPFLLVKYKGKRYLEALIYECGLAEDHLKDIFFTYGDKLAKNTMTLITYSKYTMLFSLVLLLIGVILNINTN
nr:hypothetical protein [uncultured Desulfobacter sp.]